MVLLKSIFLEQFSIITLSDQIPYHHCFSSDNLRELTWNWYSQNVLISEIKKIFYLNYLQLLILVASPSTSTLYFTTQTSFICDEVTSQRWASKRVVRFCYFDFVSTYMTVPGHMKMAYQKLRYYNSESPRERYHDKARRQQSCYVAISRLWLLEIRLVPHTVPSSRIRSKRSRIYHAWSLYVYK